MPADCQTFYVTTPIYYVNDAPHIGHAYTTVAADVLARWHRQRQEPVRFLTGTDEHGQKVLRTAEAHGVGPQEWVDRLVDTAWKPVLETLDVSNDDFIRTTEPRHKERVQRFWATLHERGEVYQGSYEGPYCVGCEEYKLPGDLVAGTGELEGQQLCPIHGRPVEMLAENNYFFRMSAYAERLLELYEANPTFVQPESARNEVIAFVRRGLQDLSISRSTFDWGIPIPWDSEHVLYVWIDALLNYATAVGYGSQDAADQALFETVWPADVHLVGKDILRFHAAIWPAMLMAADLPLPKQVFAHGWLLVGGEKMSKSKLTGIAPAQIIDTFGSDAFRYYFLRAIAFGQDGSFSWEDLHARYTAELANGLGNLASRVAAMVGKYYGGVLPEAGPAGPAEERLAELAAQAVAGADG
ncbi:methionine--tRNA ligase, partial [Actinotalea sp. C106]|uniref:methionine--tRNA ligase n=1 Tax=Actinotalea sp. C106 TaxID=2908644 RepID=UPI0020297F8A